MENYRKQYDRVSMIKRIMEYALQKEQDQLDEYSLDKLLALPESELDVLFTKAQSNFTEPRHIGESEEYIERLRKRNE